MRAAVFALLLLAGCAGRDITDETFELVIAGGRVMDPETGLDAVRHVGIPALGQPDRLQNVYARECEFPLVQFCEEGSSAYSPRRSS